MELECILRERECIVYAEHFKEDRSVGIPFGPEEMWGQWRDTGEEFELTDDEFTELSKVAIDKWHQEDAEWAVLEALSIWNDPLWNNDNGA